MTGEKQPMTTSPAAPASPRQAAAPIAAATAAGEATEAARQRAMAFAAEFKQKHAEFQAEAAGLAAEFGVDVSAIVFAPGGKQAVHHSFPGAAAARAAQQQQVAETREARKAVVDLLHKDVQGMTKLEEAKAHEAQLLELRAALERRLQEIRTATASNAAAANRPEKIRRGE